MQPAIGAFFHVRIVPLRVSAIMPIIGLRRWRRRLHRCLWGLLLNIHGWRLRHGHNRGVPVIRGIIRHSETIASITIAAITITPIITRTEPISAETKTRIETSYTNETYSPMMMSAVVMVAATAMMASTVVTATVVTSSPITPAASSAPAPTSVSPASPATILCPY